MSKGRYILDDGKFRKFWSYEVQGKRQTTLYGRIGASGSKTTKSFASPAQAEDATKKLVVQKVKKGYVEINPTSVKFERGKGKGKATAARLAKLEKQLKCKLPTEYREFLLGQNGGRPEPEYIEIPGHPYIENVGVGYIYGLYDVKDVNGLLRAINVQMPLLPKGHLPIAYEADIFSLSLNDKPGTIWFWDHEAAEEDNEDLDGETQVKFKMTQGTLLASSFDEFLGRIAAFKEE